MFCYRRSQRHTSVLRRSEFAAAAVIDQIDTLFLTGYYYRYPLKDWTSRRVAVLGDAAHPMHPFLAQGACQAIEDAAVLGHVLAAHGEADVRAEVAILYDEDAVAAHVETRREELAFSLGGMGSAGVNFYDNAYSRQGWDNVAAEMRNRWQAGDRDGASALVTDEMVLGTTLIGTEEMVRERLRVWRDAGVDTVRRYPVGATIDQKLETLERAIELVRDLDRSYGS